MSKPSMVWIDDNLEHLKGSLDATMYLFELEKLVELQTFTNSDDAISYILENQENIFLYAQDSIREESKIINAWKRSNNKEQKKHAFKTSIAGDFYTYVIDAFTPYASCIYNTALNVDKNLLDKWCAKDDRISYLIKPVDFEEIGELVVSSLKRWKHINQNVIISDDEKFLIPVSDELVSVCGHDPAFLDKLKPRQFEELINSIFKNHGYHTELTAQTRDGGYDIIAISSPKFKEEVTLVEVKHFAKHRAVGVGIIRELYGVKKLLNADKAILVTSSYVSPDAKKQFERVIPIELDIVEREKVISWCQKFMNDLLE